MDWSILGCLDLGAQLALHCSLHFETTGNSRASFWASMKTGGPAGGREEASPRSLGTEVNPTICRLADKRMGAKALTLSDQ